MSEPTHQPRPGEPVSSTSGGETAGGAQRGSGDRLRQLLAQVSPFRELPEAARGILQESCEIVECAPGELVMDGFRSPPSDVCLVLDGRVGLWNEVESLGQPDQTELSGGFFGFSGMLTGRTVGPRVRALTHATLARIPGEVARAAFITEAGAIFLANHLLGFAEKARLLPGFATTGSLVEQPPVVVDADTPIHEVAAHLTDQRISGVVVRLADGSMGLVTDGSIRRRVGLQGVPIDAPASEALARKVPVVQEGDSAGEVLNQVVEALCSAAIVTDRHGFLQGVVGLREFALSPTSSDVSLHEQLRLSSSRVELVQRTARTPEVLASLLAQGLSVEKVIRVHSGLVDTVVRRALHLCFAEHPELSLEGFTWLALGSNGRREPVLSSDIESAVIFPDGTSERTMAAYRAVFAEVDVLLAEAGLRGDTHGVSARHAVLARTVSQWQEAASAWMRDPTKDRGAVMLSLLVDSRPVFGDPALAEAWLGAHHLRRHPSAMRMLLVDSRPARGRSLPWDAPWQRRTSFDVKRLAVTPLVNLARWVALAVDSRELSTAERLRAASGADLLAEGQGPMLAQAFEALQEVRLRVQLAQVERGEQPGDLLDGSLLSPIDRSVLTQAVRAITLAQRRLENLPTSALTGERG